MRLWASRQKGERANDTPGAAGCQRLKEEGANPTLERVPDVRTLVSLLHEAFLIVREGWV